MRFASRLVALASVLALTLAVLTPPRARAVTVPPGASPLKVRQMRMMAAEPMRERAETRERLRELRKLAKRMHANGSTSLRARGLRSKPEIIDEDAKAGLVPARAGRLATPQSARAAGAVLPNVRCNDPSGDLLTPGFGNTVVEGQCETSIVRWNNYLMAAWNDGKGYDDGTYQTQGWATSTDGGLTWTDHGTFPLPPPYASSWEWLSDPVLAVNPTTGAFYFTALGESPGAYYSVGVLKGRFQGSSFAWDTASVARVGNYYTDGLDKEWLAVDPADGRVYLSYTDFKSTGSEIQFQWADSALTTWSTFRKLSTTAENGWVQGSRPIVRPDGSVVVVYYRIGTVDVDYYRVCRSTDRGVTFSLPNDAVAFYSNFRSGAPGFNRNQSVQFPSIAVDRSGGAHGGRLFLSWNESLNWFDDTPSLGSTGNTNDLESGNTAAASTPTTAGKVLRGAITNTTTDFDYFAIPMTAGQSLLAQVDSLASGLGVTLRMFATDGATRLAFTDDNSSDLASYGAAPWVFTAPAAGTYYLRVASYQGTGAYRVSTGTAVHGSERGRDQRDVFTSYSDDAGLTWSTPVRINQEAVGYDDWLPEVAVAPDGQVACAWYDWRDAPAATSGGESSVYLATSEDGGATWIEKGAVSDSRTAWTSVGTNIQPNQGDYLSLFACTEGLAVAWSDGRGGNPDTYMEWVASDRPVSTLARGVPGRVDLEWYMDRTPGTTAGLYRQVGASTSWDSIATLVLDATQHFHYADTTGVVEGETYRYQLGVVTSGTERFYPYVTVRVGAPGIELAGAWPNPARQDSYIAFTLPTAEPAKLSLHDINGRRLYSITVTGPGNHKVPLVQDKRIEPGVYYVRLEQSGRKLSHRIVVL